MPSRSLRSMYGESPGSITWSTINCLIFLSTRLPTSLKATGRKLELVLCIILTLVPGCTLVINTCRQNRTMHLLVDWSASAESKINFYTWLMLYSFSSHAEMLQSMFCPSAVGNVSHDLWNYLYSVQVFCSYNCCCGDYPTEPCHHWQLENKDFIFLINQRWLMHWFSLMLSFLKYMRRWRFCYQNGHMYPVFHFKNILIWKYQHKSQKLWHLKIQPQ